MFEQENLEAAHRCLDFELLFCNKIIHVCNQGICSHASCVLGKTRKFLGRNGLNFDVTPLFLDCQHPKWGCIHPVPSYCPDIVIKSSSFTLKYLDLVTKLYTHTSIPFKSDNTNLENCTYILLLCYCLLRATDWVPSIRQSEALGERNG